jgi:hypothetical protein
MYKKNVIFRSVNDEINKKIHKQKNRCTVAEKCGRISPKEKIASTFYLGLYEGLHFSGSHKWAAFWAHCFFICQHLSDKRPFIFSPSSGKVGTGLCLWPPTCTWKITHVIQWGLGGQIFLHLKLEVKRSVLRIGWLLIF